MKARTTGRIAWPLSGLAALLGGMSLAFLAVNRTSLGANVYSHWLADAAVAIAFPAVGALIVSRHPRNALGWILCVAGLALGVARFASEYANYTLIAAPGALSGGVVAAWVNSWATYIGFGFLPFIPLLFPDGRPSSSRWRPVAWLTAGFIVLAAVSYALMPGPLEEHPSVENPLGIAGTRPFFELLVGIAVLTFMVCLLASVLSLILRFSRSRGDERQQLKWFTYAAASLPISLVANGLFPAQAWLIGAIPATFMPLAIGIAVLKYRLYDIDVVINRTLVYGTLTACVIGVYVLVVGYLGALFRTGGNLAVSLVATGIVAVLFAPLRDRLQRTVNRLMYGERDDPYAVVSRLGQRLEATLAPDAVLSAIVETVRETLRLPYAAITLTSHGSPTAQAGEPVADPLRLPLSYQNEPVGELLLGSRTGEEGFSPADRRLLDDLARQAGVAAYAVGLTSDLQRARERLVTAREEERRRLRRDLHDGLGAQLAGLNMQAGVLRNLIHRDPGTADDLVVEMREELRAAISDIRRLVHDLRPPALDDLGLVGALERLAERYGAEGEGPRVLVEAPESDSLPPLPAAAEVAVYRIVQEALTNVARHARARNCVVRLAVNSDALKLDIADDGVGLSVDRRSGVGLVSMRERAVELGGACSVEPVPEGGTLVSVRLPLRKE